MATPTPARADAPAIEVAAHPGEPLGMTPAEFLRSYWQKHPLLVRGAFPGFVPPLQPEDLAGLACEEDALARLVLRERRRDAWELRHGPFTEEDFASLPETDWTLLVQDVEKWDADLVGLLDHFRFLPSWRIDDIMVSYAVPGGGVGPHVDQYDVFLLQGLGHRQWAIDVAPVDLEPRADTELRLLQRFTPTHEWLLAPGDMLYLPPGVPHDGVATDACMTFSVGMRAPGIGEMLMDCADWLALRMPDSLRYADADLAPADAAPGQIDARTLDRLRAAIGPLAEGMSHDALGLWFGTFITRYRSARVPAPPEHQISAGELEGAVARGAMLLRNPWSRLAWLHRGHGAILFASGESRNCPEALARALCSHRYWQPEEPLEAPTLDVLVDLVNEGHLVLSAPGVSADG